VAGRGLARLRAAGLAVVLAEPGEAKRAAQELNIGFFSRVLRGRPWVRMKIAASLDGRSALADGRSQWITGAAARADGHAWRRRAGAVLTGIGTVLADDPRLDVRLVPSVLQPLRVVADSRLRTPPAARLLARPGVMLVCATASPGGQAPALAARGAEIVVLPGEHGRIDLRGLLAALAERGINELHVEAGATLNAALLRSGLVDELVIYLAPTLLGAGRPMAELGPYARLAQGIPLQFQSVGLLGADLRLRARLAGAADWLPAAAKG
jgi:diaminohydroxyphosphoribosylaminopyrimidine deaminase/5-amino-6-(5-phosphoribosylamino)uracil reductase